MIPKKALILIVSYLTGAVFLIEIASGVFSLPRAMQNFMAGFFLVFSFFKMLDLRGFADAYRTYDLLAQAVLPWGWMYPFAELALGIAYRARGQEEPFPQPRYTPLRALLLPGRRVFPRLEPSG